MGDNHIHKHQFKAFSKQLTCKPRLHTNTIIFRRGRSQEKSNVNGAVMILSMKQQQKPPQGYQPRIDQELREGMKDAKKRTLGHFLVRAPEQQHFFFKKKSMGGGGKHSSELEDVHISQCENI